MEILTSIHSECRWYFDFVTGQLNAYNPETNEFETMVEPDSPTTGHSSAIRKSADAGGSIAAALKNESSDSK